MLGRLLIALAALLAAEATAAADAPAADDRAKSMGAARVATPPVIDGLLDDSAWQAARPETRFTQNFPDEGKPPTEATTVLLMYDDHALYVGVRCDDRTPTSVVERLTRRDRDTDADKITVDIDSRYDHTSAYHFDVNVSGVLADGVRFNDVEYNGDWDGVWNAVPHRSPDGWTVEFEIPWRTLRFAGGNPVMGFQVRRYLPRRQEVDEWAYVPRTVRGEVSRYGRLAGVGDLGPARLIQIWPYAASRLALRTQFAAQNGLYVAPEVGVDLKIGITSSLTLDATINPDFGQVEADQVQLNLTTFELFYPEKRPFFLEGVDLFGTPIRQFYTRRVGRPPPSPYLNTNDAVLDEADTGRIWGAVKLTGQLIPHLSVAFLDALTARQEATVRRADGRVDGPRLVDPLTNFAIARARADFGNSYVGVTGTAVDRFEPPGDAAVYPDQCPDPDDGYPSPFGYAGTPPRQLGTPAVVAGRRLPDTSPVSPARAQSGPDHRPDPLTPPRGRCTHDAYTGGLDARLITGDSTWGVVFHALASSIQNGPPRARPDGTVIRAGDGGWGVSVQAGKQGGKHVLFGIEYAGYSPSLDINDAGYLRQANLHHVAGVFTLRSTRPIGPTQESSWDLFTYHDLSWTGLRLTDGAGTWLWTRFRNFWQLGTGAGYNFGYFDNRETRDGTVTERAGQWWWGLYARTDPRSRLLAQLNVDANGRQEGSSWATSLTLTVHPMPQIELDVTPRFSYTYGDPRWFATDEIGDGTRRYHFGDLESISADVTLRGIYTFTPRLTLQAYAQVFLASGHYGGFRSAVGAGERPTLPISSFQMDRCPTPTSDRKSCDPTTSPDFREGAININIVLRWEYLPASTLLGVYTHSQSQMPYDPAYGPGMVTFSPFAKGPATDVFLVKLSYLWG